MNQGPQWWKSGLIAVLALGGVCMVSYPTALFSSGRPADSLPFQMFIGLAVIVLAMEALAWFGKARNMTWFAGLVIAWLLVYLSLPILYLMAPEYVFPTHDAEDIMMARSLGLLTLFIAFSAFIRILVLPMMAPPRAKVSTEDAQPIDSIAPSRGKTIQTILQEQPKAQARFLFGMSDRELVQRWGVLAQAMLSISRTRTRQTLVLLAILVIWPFAFWLGSGGSEGAMRRDVAALREYTHASGGRKLATNRAVHAALRIFHEADANQLFTGKTRKEINDFLELDKMNPEYRTQVLSPGLEEGASREKFLSLDDGQKQTGLELNWDTMGARKDRIVNIDAAWSTIPVWLARERHEPKVWNAISTDTGWNPPRKKEEEF